MNNNDEQLLLVNGRIIASPLFLITIGISIVLLYNQKLILENKEPILTDQEALDIALFIKVLATILLAFFLYTSVKEYENNINTKKEEDSFDQTFFTKEQKFTKEDFAEDDDDFYDRKKSKKGIFIAIGVVLILALLVFLFYQFGIKK